MATLTLDNLKKSYGRARGRAWGQLRCRRRRAGGRGRAVGVREIDASAHGRGTGGNHRGRGGDRRTCRQRRRAQGPRHRHGVPELRALPAYELLRQHGLRAAHATECRATRSARGSTAPRRSSARGAARPQAAPAFRRPAPARRDGPGHRPRPEGVPVRRAAVEPRRQAAGADAGRDQAAAAGTRHHLALRHARPGRGDDPRRPADRDECRQRRPDRPAARPLRAAGDRVRRRVHRLARR